MSFVAIPALIGPMLGPVAGGLIVRVLPLEVIFFVNLPIGLVGLSSSICICRTTAKSIPTARPWGSSCSAPASRLLSYVLEVFGEHTLSAAKSWGFSHFAHAARGYGLHASGPRFHSALICSAFAHFARLSSGSFFTRLGIGGVPFLLPLLYQVGLGFTPVQSGLLMMPQAIAAMSLKITMPRILARFGYRGVLISNTIDPRPAHSAFRDHRPGTPVWFIVVQAFCYGGFTSLQYTSMNTLVYADVENRSSKQLHRQHHAAALDQFRCRRGGAHHRIFHPRQREFKPGDDNSRHP